MWTAPRTEAITGTACTRGAVPRRWSGGPAPALRGAPAPTPRRARGAGRRRRARGGRSRGRARRRRRRAWAATSSREDPGDHGGHLGLVGAAGAGDGRLDLGRGVQRRPGSPRRAAASSASAAAWAVVMTRGDVDVGEDPLDRDRVGLEPVEPRVSSVLEVDAAAPRCRLAAGCARRRRRPAALAARPPSTTPMPHRVRPGSTPSTRTRSLPLSDCVSERSEHVFGSTLHRRPPQARGARRSGSLAGAADAPWLTPRPRRARRARRR